MLIFHVQEYLQGLYPQSRGRRMFLPRSGFCSLQRKSIQPKRKKKKHMLMKGLGFSPHGTAHTWCIYFRHGLEGFRMPSIWNVASTYRPSQAGAWEEARKVLDLWWKQRNQVTTFPHESHHQGSAIKEAILRDRASKGTWDEEAAGTSRPSPAAPVFLSSCCFFCLTNAEVNGIL